MVTKRNRDALEAETFFVLIGHTGNFPDPPYGMDRAAIYRFWSKVDLAGEHWLWSASVDTVGAGKFALTPELTLKAHRLAWQLLRGPLVDGMDLIRVDSCGYPHCVNPRHREPGDSGAKGGREGGRGNVKAAPGGQPLAVSQRMIDTLHELARQGHSITRACQTLGLGPTAETHIIKGNAVGVR